jgi:hypothetical protein
MWRGQECGTYDREATPPRGVENRKERDRFEDLETDSHQHVSAAIEAIFRVILLQEYKSTNVVSCEAVTT